MDAIPIGVRNNLDVPIRLTLTKVGYQPSQEDARILITIGKEGVALKDYYRVCVDADVSPNEDWEEVGFLKIDAKCEASVMGLKEGG